MGKLTKVTDIAKAKVFVDSAKANNVIRNSLRKSEQNKWFAKPIIEVDKRLKAKQIKEMKINDSDIDGILDNLESQYNKIQDIMTTIEQIKTESLKCKAKFCEELSIIDQEISDIYHFIAFEKVCVTKWVKIYKLLKEILLKRANVKNKIRKIEVLIQNYSNDFDKEKIINSLNEQEHEVYTPRTNIYEKLFNL